MEYRVGIKLECNGVTGVVVENTKLPGDICVKWETMDFVVSYDKEWLDENVRAL